MTSRFRLFLDITRMCQRRYRSTPSGIDRVEFAYFDHAMTRLAPEDVVYVLTSSMARGVISAERARAVYDGLVSNWSAASDNPADLIEPSLLAELKGPLAWDRTSVRRISAPRQGATWGTSLAISARDLLRAGTRLRRQVDKAKGKTNVYLHTSHSQLDRPELFDWLRTSKTPAVFFLHDIIPVDFPEFCRAGEDEKHRLRLRTMSDHAALILVNSDYTADAARHYFSRNDMRTPPMVTVPLGVEGVFRSRSGLKPVVAKHPYAVVLGTIEARKNIAFLLGVWRRLVEQRGAAAPRLVIIGRRGWENENVLDILERSTLLAPFVIEASDLTDSGVATVMAGADMLLAPSLVEGFDLPVAEALSLGVPVIASDIPGHREVGGGLASLVDPLDGPGWIAAIDRHLTGRFDRKAPRVTGYNALNWQEHVALAFKAIDQHIDLG